jgi:hypothetical protein
MLTASHAQGMQSRRPLTTALSSLQERFNEILHSQGLSAEKLKCAHLLFEFPPSYTDDYRADCHACLVSKTGRIFRQSVDYLGRPIVPNQSLNPDPPASGRAG